MDRLDSWKEIANYVKRDIKTCMNWTKYYDFPVYRLNPKSKCSPVFAFKKEIDDWFYRRKKLNNTKVKYKNTATKKKRFIS